MIRGWLAKTRLSPRVAQGEHVPVVGATSVVQKVEPDVGRGDGQEPDDQMDRCPGHHGKEPEPQEDVDLFVNDVDGQDAEAVFPLHGTGGTVVVEGALGHLWEHLRREKQF